jgi:hypothetical protein
MNKHARECRSLCEKSGLSVLALEQRGKRIAVVCTAGTVIVPRSPSDCRWQKNALAQARRIADLNRLPINPRGIAPRYLES